MRSLLLSLSLLAASVAAAPPPLFPGGDANTEAAFGFSLIGANSTPAQHYEGVLRLRNAGARGNLDALRWSAVHDFDTCRARFVKTGTYRKTCADFYATLVGTAARYCARGEEQDLRYTLPYRVALEEQSRGNTTAAAMWHLANLRHCAKAKEHYPAEVATAFTTLAGKNEEAMARLSPQERADSSKLLEAADSALAESGMAPS